MIHARGRGIHGEHSTQYHYDALGRRVAKQMRRMRSDGTQAQHRTEFQWLGMSMVQVLDEERLQTYIYSPDSPYTPLARVDQNRQMDGQISPMQTVYHHHAHDNGQVQSVTDESGEVIWSARYGAFGRLNLTQRPDFKSFNEQLRFAGQYADEETGLHYNTFRYYDPEVGRFVSSDPIGLLGGVNLYRYAPNTTGWIDPWGWCSKKLGKNLGNRPANSAAHHLVGDTSKKAQIARDILKKHGIDIDSAANGYGYQTKIIQMI